MDYSKLKVTELKEELKARGIPGTGLKLKQHFIDKLVAADAVGHQSARVSGKPQSNAQEARQKQALPDVPVVEGGEIREAAATAPHLVADPLSNDGSQKAVIDAEKANDIEADAATMQNASAEAITTNQTDPEEPKYPPTLPSHASLEAKSTHPYVAKEVGIVPADPEDSVETRPPSAIAPASGTSTPSSLQIPPKEILEDSKKRKRRSLTPPPTNEDIAQKKAKASDGSPRVTKTEPSASEKIQNATNQAETLRSGNELIPEPEANISQTVPDEAPTTGNVERMDIGATSMAERVNATDVSAQRRLENEVVVSNINRVHTTEANGPDAVNESEHDGRALNGQSSGTSPAFDPRRETASPRESPTSTRIRILSPMKPERKSPTPSDQAQTDREISAALHPATSSLYIRNFKRPLHVPTLRSHLSKLSTPPSGTTPSAKDAITTFYLDSIRTHAFIQFESISAASRVRSALHNTRFPDEKTRETLWVDFIPDEKVQTWIDVESNTGGGRAIGKRWEVVYEEGRDGVDLFLQEAGPAGEMRKHSGISQRQTSVPDLGAPAPTAVPSVHPDRAPFVPQDAIESPPSRRDSRTIERTENAGTGFRVLDELFSFTNAKPKLYFQPVSPRVADRRMDAMKDLRVGHSGMGRSGDEGMKRYSFEVDRGREEWVDKGPEFGYGRRGPGGPGGRCTYRGRGRYREDSWRGRGY